MSTESSNGHGGRRKGSGRKKKDLFPSQTQVPSHAATSILSHPLTSNHAQQLHNNHDTIPVPNSVFFTGRIRSTAQSIPQLHTAGISSTTQTQSEVITNSELNRLRNEVEEVMNNDEYAEIRIQEGRVIDESISDTMDDSMEGNAEAAAAETEETETAKRSVNHQHLLDYRNSLQKQIQKYRMPKCYKDGQFFVHPPHPVFALHQAARTSFSPDPLCLRSIFVWLPEYLPGCPDSYKCECGSYLTMNGYNDSPIARRVRTSTGQDYYLFTNRFICDSRRIKDSGCGTSYQGTDTHILAQLPRWVQEAFPAFITARSAVDKHVIDLMKPCFAGRFGPEPFSKMLLELQTLHHSRRELTYLAAAHHYGLSGKTQVPQFPKFDDHMKYAGNAPSVRYIKSIWTDYHGGIKIYVDRIQASLSAYKLAEQIMKAMARLKAEPTFAALFSLMNEWEEIRAQAMALTKGFSILPEMFKQVSIGLKEHGHKPTALYYCDNPTAERDFHERVTESLSSGVQHIISEPGKNLPKFKLDPRTVAIEYFDSSMLINNACEEILEHVEQLTTSEQVIIGLSICCITGTEKLKSIQLRTAEKILVFHVIQLQANNVPSCLHSLLTSPRIIKVGYNIERSVSIILASLSIVELQAVICQSEGPFLDLGKLAKVKGVVSDPCAAPSLIVPAVLKKRYPPVPSIVSETPPSEEDTNTLATEVECIWQTYICMSRQGSVGLELQKSDATIGQLVTLVLARKEVAEGTILEHNGSAEFIMDVKGTKTITKITPAYLLIQIDKVLVPGAILSKHSQTVQWMFDHGGKAVVQTRTLRTRHATPPLPPDPLSSSILGIPAPPPAFLTGIDPILLLGSTEQIVERIEQDTGNNNEGSDDEGDSNSEDDENPTEEDDCRPTSKGIVIDTLQYCQTLLTQCAEESQSLPTRVFDDIFHFMDRLLRTLPKSHSAFKEFAYCWDRDGLPLYRTIRGTNSIEGGVHMAIRRIFGSLRASPELAVSLLSNWILRRNTRVGHFNRTGNRWKSHFDIWTTDEIVELAVSVDTLPSFRIPSMLATRIATSESFGIIPIPPLLAKEYHIAALPPRRIEGLPHHRDTPSHLLVRLSTNIISPYRYLQLFQRTIYPVVPIHTRAEYVEFKRFLRLAGIRNNRSDIPPSQAWKGIDYVKFAQMWNLKVSTQDPGITDSNERLYYKLPEQLLRHHKKSLEWQTSRATMSLGANVEKVKDHLNTLNDSERVAYVLPAIPLEDTSSQVDPTVDGLRGLDLTSFNPMALRRTDLQGQEHFDADFECQPNPTTATDTVDPPPPHNEAHPATQPLLVPETETERAAQYQTTLSFRSTSAGSRQQTATIQAGSKKRKKRGCAVCCEFDCPQADSCDGSGGRDKCYTGPCNHPNIGKKRVRK
ncbi:hypothetical protein BT96DRAFT_996110 [Gymnopus androsaceus JB14]|uniref:DUF6729 domain-containing protein n=1 Tax=Gymnopus androsaceus JB14 TaxID=1447944 RepID=A0A6A4HJ73_9AGAR|nr:hypothetical protein BT96DRAFT_996110 [Gymnopus androsaceus JB14]